MRTIGRAVMALFLLSTGLAMSEDLPFVLLVPESSVATEDAEVTAEAAFGIACTYGLDPEVGKISVKLRLDDDYGLHWHIGYVDWSAVRGTSGFNIDAVTGAVVGRLTTTTAHEKPRLEYEIDSGEAAIDKSPPPEPRVQFAGARRGYYPKRDCLMRIEVDNARYGIIEAYLLELSDDRTPREDMGFVLEQIGGTRPLPDSWTPRGPYYPRIKFHPDSLMVFISWDDGNDEIQEPVSTRFAVYAVDKAGNRSATPDTLVVELPGG